MDTGFSKEELRTIDALVTVFVMEYPVVIETPELQEPGASTGSEPTDAVKRDSKRSPPWSRDESLAMNIVERFIDEGFLVTIQGHKNGWTVSLSYPYPAPERNLLDHHASAATLPLAICLASLHAVGIEQLPAT